MASAEFEPGSAEPYGRPTPRAPRRAARRGGATTVPGPAKPRRAKADADRRTTESALLRLTAEVGGDTAVVWQFVSDYLDLLEHRLSAVESAVVAGNRERAEVALLSLESTSLMVGADAIVRSVRPVRAAVEQTDFLTAESKLPALRQAEAAERARLEQMRAERGPKA